MAQTVIDLGRITVLESWSDYDATLQDDVECTVAARVFLATNQAEFHTNEFYDSDDGQLYDPTTLNNIERGHVYILTCTKLGYLDIYTPFRYFSKEEWAVMTQVLGSSGRLSFLSVDGVINKLAVFPYQIKNFYRIPIRYLGNFIKEVTNRGYSIVNKLVKEKDLVRRHKEYSDAGAKYSSAISALNSCKPDMDEIVSSYSACLAAYEEYSAAIGRFLQDINSTTLQEDAPLRARYHKMFVDLSERQISLLSERPDMMHTLNRLRVARDESLLPSNTANEALLGPTRRIVAEIFSVLGSPWLKRLEKDYILLLTSTGEEVKFSSVDGLLLNESHDPEPGNQDEDDYTTTAQLGDDSLADL